MNLHNMSAAELDKSSSGLYRLIIPRLPGIELDQDFTMNIYNIVLPGISFPPLESHWQGAKMKDPVVKAEFEDWQFTFMVDEKWKNWRTLFKHFTFINNNKDHYADQFSNVSFEATLEILDNFKSPIFKVNFVRAWISSLGSVNMNTRDDEIILESTCTFVYDYYEIMEID